MKTPLITLGVLVVLFLLKTHACLDKNAPVLFPAPVQMMPIMNVTCAKRSQGHLSFWRAIRAVGIVEETF